MGSNRFTRIITPEQRKTASESTGQYRRKLSAIFSADVQGYSRLMGSNEEMTVQTIITYRDLIARVIHYNGGRVVDSPGDNILAEFESPIDAVKSSLEIQKQINERNQELDEKYRMKFRIGLNFGDIIEEEGRLYGDGVNIAARLESLAEGGGICISGSIYDRIKGNVPVKVDYLGAKSVKNISKKVPTYKIVMDRGISAVMHETKIVLAPIIISAFLFFMYMLHFRYLLSDFDVMPYLILNPVELIKAQLPFFIGLWLAIILFIIFVHIKRGVSTILLRLFKGSVFFCLIYTFLYFPLSYIPEEYSMGIESSLYNSNHEFAVMLTDSVKVYAKPRSDSDLLVQLNKSNVVRINESITTQYNTWKQGQLENDNNGWIKLKQTAVNDHPEKLNASSALYSYRIMELVCVIFGLIGFIWGFRSGTT